MRRTPRMARMISSSPGCSLMYTSLSDIGFVSQCTHVSTTLSHCAVGMDVVAVTSV